MVLNAEYVIDAFKREARNIESDFRKHSSLGLLLTHEFLNRTPDQVKETYLDYLDFTRRYVEYTRPMLMSSGEALANGDEEDKHNSKNLFGYAKDETTKYQKKQVGHQIWAEQDMKNLDAPEEIFKRPTSDAILSYGKYFVEGSRVHPYGPLGAKGVLEHLALIIAGPITTGLKRMKIPNIGKALTFLETHGELDVEHSQEGNEKLKSISNPDKLKQILEGAYFTSGSYRAFLDDVL